MLRSASEKELNQTTNWLARVFSPVDQAMMGFGSYVEANRKKRRVYPVTEIYTPSHLDSEKAYMDYMSDAAYRKMNNQLRPGEIVTEMPDGRLSVQGQAAVMAINALLTKVIFEKNPNSAFYIEESMPLEWMYPHLTPFGIIMKLNRDEVSTISEEMLEKDHAFLLEGDVFTKDNIETYVSYKRENEVASMDPRPHPHEFNLYYDA